MRTLVFEELERRNLMAGEPIAMAATAITNNSVEDFFASQVGTEAGQAGGTGMFNPTFAGNPNTISPALLAEVNATLFLTMAVPGFPAATTGVGQMTITTGANTPGISSFAFPTAGPSRAGGTGRVPTVPQDERLGPAPGLSALSEPLRDALIASRARISKIGSVEQVDAVYKQVGRGQVDLTSDAPAVAMKDAPSPVASPI